MYQDQDQDQDHDRISPFLEQSQDQDREIPNNPNESAILNLPDPDSKDRAIWCRRSSWSSLGPGVPRPRLPLGLVCKRWRRLLADGAFLQQYRAFHRAPPVLGFFQHRYRKGTGFADGDPVAWAGVWSAATSVAVDFNCFVDVVVMPSLLAGDTIYFSIADGERILKYSLVGHVISVMSMPPLDESEMILAAQDGELRAATMEGYSLHLCRVIELAVMIPMSIGDPTTLFHLACFAQCVGLMFVCANEDIFTVELKTGQVTKIGKRTSYEPIFPFTSFYTPDLVMTGRL